MIYEVYERRPVFDYLTETYTTILEHDIPLQRVEQRNRQILQSIVDGNACSVDLSSLTGLTFNLVLEFISVSHFNCLLNTTYLQYWIHSPSPNDFNYLCLWKNFNVNGLEQQIRHENVKVMDGGLLEFRHCSNKDLRLYVDAQRLFLNMCVKSAIHVS
jgi:hypothetical protein